MIALKSRESNPGGEAPFDVRPLNLFSLHQKPQVFFCFSWPRLSRFIPFCSGTNIKHIKPLWKPLQPWREGTTWFREQPVNYGVSVCVFMKHFMVLSFYGQQHLLSNSFGWTHFSFHLFSFPKGYSLRDRARAWRGRTIYLRPRRSELEFPAGMAFLPETLDAYLSS